MPTKREKHIINAEGQVLGRLATRVALLLRGKHKPEYTNNQDIGDIVVVQNADKLVFTGRKLTDKSYYWHSGYIGGLKERRLEEVIARDPGQALRLAVSGMLPKNKLRPLQLKRLKFE